MTIEQKRSITQLRNSGQSYNLIAATLGLSRSTVRSYLSRITTAESPTSNCKCCDAMFPIIPGHRTREYCSAACRLRSWREAQKPKEAAV